MAPRRNRRRRVDGEIGRRVADGRNGERTGAETRCARLHQEQLESWIAADQRIRRLQEHVPGPGRGQGERRCPGAHRRPRHDARRRVLDEGGRAGIRIDRGKLYRQALADVHRGGAADRVAEQELARRGRRLEDDLEGRVPQADELHLVFPRVDLDRAVALVEAAPPANAIDVRGHLGPRGEQGRRGRLQVEPVALHRGRGRRAQLDRLVLQGRSRLAGPVATLDAGRPETRENLPGEPIPDLAVVMHFAVEAVDGIDAELVADGPVALARTSGKRIVHFADERRGVRLDRGDETADLAPAGLRGGHRIGAPFVHRPRLV